MFRALQLQGWSISPCTQVLSMSLCPPQLPPSFRHQHEMLSPRCPHLVLLFEAIAFCRLHLVDMLEEICHPHSGMKLPGVIRGPFAATLAAGGTSQQAAGLVDHAAALVACRRGGRSGGLSGDQKLQTMSPSPPRIHRGMREHLEAALGDAGAAAGLSLGTTSSPDPPCAHSSSSYTTKLQMPITHF